MGVALLEFDRVGRTFTTPRGAVKDFAHFLNFSKGSCGEVRTQLYIARKLDSISKIEFNKLIAETKEISAMLQGLRRSVLPKTKATNKKRLGASA